MNNEGFSPLLKAIADNREDPSGVIVATESTTVHATAVLLRIERCATKSNEFTQVGLLNVRTEICLTDLPKPRQT